MSSRVLTVIPFICHLSFRERRVDETRKQGDSVCYPSLKKISIHLFCVFIRVSILIDMSSVNIIAEFINCFSLLSAFCLLESGEVTTRGGLKKRQAEKRYHAL